MSYNASEPIYKGKFDVIVAGGGVAGVAAAVAAQRAGAKTLLIEKNVNLGGLATIGLISYYEPMCDNQGKQLVFGIAEELIRLSAEVGFDNLPEQWGGKGPNRPTSGRFMTNYSPGIFSAQLDEYLIKNGVTLRLDSLITRPVMEGNHCRGLMVESTAGCEYFEADAFVDATGNALLMQRAGVPCEEGTNFYSCVFHYYITDEAEEKLTKKRDSHGFRKWMCLGADRLGNRQPDNVPVMIGDDPDQTTEYLVRGKLEMLEKFREIGKDNFDLMTLPDMPQYRTTRRIIGKCDFECIDGKVYEDSIGTASDFRPSGTGKCYTVPFGSLYSPEFDNLICAGRIISSPPGDPWEVTRVIPICALTGEAAGKAAAYVSRNHVSMDQIHPSML